MTTTDKWGTWYMSDRLYKATWVQERHALRPKDKVMCTSNMCGIPAGTKLRIMNIISSNLFRGSDGNCYESKYFVKVERKETWLKE